METELDFSQRCLPRQVRLPSLRLPIFEQETMCADQSEIDAVGIGVSLLKSSR